MKKQPVLIVTLLVLLMASGMLLTWFIASSLQEPATNDSKTEEVEKTDDKQQETAEPTEEEKEATKETEENKQSSESNEPMHDKPVTNKQMIDKEKANLAEQSARNLFRQFQFTEGVQYLYDYANEYKKDGNGKILSTLYEDGSYLIHFEHMGTNEDGHSGSPENVKGMLEAIQDPEMALLGLLAVDLEMRNEIIPSLESLNPVFEGSVQILNKTTVEETDFDRYQTMFSLKTLHRIDFVVEGHELYAYVAEDPEGYSIAVAIHETKKGTTPFLTVREWSKLQEKINQ